MKALLHKTIKKFRHQLEWLLEDIKLEKEAYTLGLYFDTVYLQRAALGYKDYYFDDEKTFRTEKFNNDTTLVCSLVSGGFVGQFRLLPPHQNEFLNKINSHFDGTDYDHWRDEVYAFVEQANLDLGADDFLSHLQSQRQEALITEYTESTKRGFNVSHCLLPWDRRLASWERKKLFVIESETPDYNAIFSSKRFNSLKNAMDRHREHKISNFIDSTALLILIERTIAFREAKSKLAPRLFLPTTSLNLFRTVLSETGLDAELEYPFEGRKSSVLRNEAYFFYRSFFQRQSNNQKAKTSTDWSEEQLQELYEQASEIVDRRDSINTLDVQNRSLQDVIEGVENYSFLKNVWIEFINSGELKDIVSNLTEIREQFEQAKRTYREFSFASQIKEGLKRTRKNIFDNLDEVKRASLLWEDINKTVAELRGKLSKTDWDEDALFRNCKLFRYGFPDESHADIKRYLFLLLSPETEAETTRKAIGRVVSRYMRARSLEEADAPQDLIFITAILCALDLKDELKTLLERPKKRIASHYSLRIAFAGAELESNNYEKGKCLIDELEKLYYSDSTTSAGKCDLAIGLTYLYYYAWLSLKRSLERNAVSNMKPAEINLEINRLINNAIVFAERATSLVEYRPVPQRVYVYNQYLFCLVESDDPANNRKKRSIAPKLFDYRDQPDTWSYMYSDTLARYFRWRAVEQKDENLRKRFMKEALSLGDEALALAPNDEEVRTFHTKLVDESDKFELLASSET